MYDDIKDFFNPFTNSKAIAIILIVGSIVYFNSLFNPFILDDYVQIVNSESIRSLSNIPLYFLKGQVFSGNHLENIINMHYKPLFYSAYSLIYFFSGNNPFLFHLSQLSLYLANSILVFLIFSKFFNKKLSFILALLLLVHPLNSEVAIYIATLQDVLFMFFGLLGFYLILKNKKTVDFKNLFLISFLFLCSLLSKETGVLFLFIYLAYTWLFNRFNFKAVTIGVSIPLIFYIILRYIASFPPILATKYPSYIQEAPFSDLLLTIPKIFFYYLSNLIAPVHLAAGQVWVVREANLQDFFLPLTIDILIIFLFIAFGVFIYKRRKNLFKQYVFFSFWFWLGVIPHTQFLIQLDFTVADRWFYFSMIGLAGVIGTIIVAFKNVIKGDFFKKSMIFIVTSLIVILSILTIARNSQWRSALELYGHEAKRSENPKIYNFYGALLMANGRLDEAKPYLEKSIIMDPRLGSNINNLAKFYLYKKDFIKAKELYWQNIKFNNKEVNYKDESYIGLSQLALFIDRQPGEAKKFALLAAKENNNNLNSLLYLSIAQYLLGDKEESLKTAEKLYSLQPNRRTQAFYLLIRENKLTTINDPIYGQILFE